MSHSNNEKLITWMKILMICAGFWDQDISSSRFANKIFYGYSVFMKLCCTVFWIFLVTEMLRLIIFRYDTAIITANMAILLTDTKIVVKMVIYLKCNTLGIFKDMVKNEAEIWAANNEEINRMYRKKITFLKFAIIALGASTVVAVFLLQVSGGITVLQHRRYNALFNATVESHVMYQTILPLHRNNHIYWLFSTQVLFALVGISSNVVTQLIFVTILLYAASRLEVLQVRFRNFVEPDFHFDAAEEVMNEKVMKLKSLIKEYQYTIRFIQDFNQSTKYITMIEFGLSTLDMASGSAGVTKMKGYESLWLLFFIMVLLTQLFLIGWTSNEITTQSEAISTAIYESKWYELNKECKQLILITITRAQRPLNMTIGPMGPMTTGSILAVCVTRF